MKGFISAFLTYVFVVMSIGLGAKASPPFYVVLDLNFATYFGGSGEETARDVAIDSSGNIYVAGGTASSGFPVTSGSFDTGFNGNHDVWVAKFSAAGVRQWATFIGGSNYDRAYAIEVDDTGVYVAGRAGDGFPVSPTGVLQTNFGGDSDPNGLYGNQDGFIFKLSLDGTTGVWATYVGGGGPEFIRDIAVDSSGNVYAAMAEVHSGFPHISTGAFDESFNGGTNDGGLVKISANGSTVVYGTYIGGSNWDGGTPSVRVNASGEAFLLQGTGSTNMPVTANCLQSTKGSGTPGDSHLTKFNSTGTAPLLFATYFGGNSNDYSETHGLALDEVTDEPIIAITTKSTNLTTTANAFQDSYQGSGGSGTGNNTNYAGDGFVAKLSSDGETLVAATYIGGSVGEGVEGVSVDGMGNIYVTGATYSSDFPTSGDAYQGSKSGSADFFMVVLSPDVSMLNYGTFVGGGGIDYCRSSTIDPSDSTFVAVGHSASSNFPVLNAQQSSNAGGTYDAAIVKVAPGTPPSNLAPSVNAGTDQTITLPASASLDGTVTDDGEPNPPGSVTTTWSKITGPGTVTFGNTSLVDTTASFSSSGTYVLRLTADDSDLVTTDDVTITVADPATGSLSVSYASPGSSANLTSEGPIDWAHWGNPSASSFNHKSGVTQQISNYTKIGTGSVTRANAGPVVFSWTDGTPTSSASNIPYGIYIRGVGNGFQITVPANTTDKTLKLYIGLWKSQGKLDVTLSDSSASQYIDTSFDDSGTNSVIRVYTINFRAGSSGQTLVIKWTQVASHDGNSSVNLRAATM